jgi:hypothetical protein
MPKGKPKSAARKARAAALRHCHEAFDFTGYGLQLFDQRFHQSSDGTRIGWDLYSAFLARFVHEDRLDASQAQRAWPTSVAMLRAASDNIEPASGRGFAFAHVIPGVGVGRSKKPDRKLRKAGDAVGKRELRRAVLSGAIQVGHDQEAPAFTPGRLH